MNKKEYDEMIENLSNKTTNIKKTTETINEDKPIFYKKDYNLIEGEPIYFEPDEFGRSNGAIALISKNTMPLFKKKRLKYKEPFGWKKDFENKNLFEKCHIIAYSLSAQIVDEKNIFIGTRSLNRSYMKKVENKVSKYLEDHDNQVLYRATVKYKGRNSIPTGILIEVEAIEDDFSLCKFCYNVQKGVKFKYSNGSIQEDTRILSNLEKLVDKVFKPRKRQNNNENFEINRLTREFHTLGDNRCERLSGVESKYINQTTATRKDLINADFKPCKKCIIKEEK